MNTQTNNLISSAVSIVFYLLMAGFVVYSMLALYSLLKFGNSRILGVTVSLIYLVVSAILYAAALSNLGNLKF